MLYRIGYLVIMGLLVLSCTRKESEEKPKLDADLIDWDAPGFEPHYFALSDILEPHLDKGSDKGNKIPSDNKMSLEGVELGRHLFYDNILSRDKTISCASCHKQEFAFTDDKRFSTGVRAQNATRSSMSVANLIWTDSLFWDGRVSSLEEQVLKPIENPIEMDLPIDSAILRLQQSPKYVKMFYKTFGVEKPSKETLAKAIAQFERTLISQNSKFDEYILTGKEVFTEQEKHGKDLFFSHASPTDGIRGGECSHCHGGYNLTFNKFSNNGLDANALQKDAGRYDVTKKQFDIGKFRVPTLRNIALTAPYMHDGRFSTLEEVLDHYSDHIEVSPQLDALIRAGSNEQNAIGLKLTKEEKADIIAFLKTLSDPQFITNEKLSTPFK